MEYEDSYFKVLLQEMIDKDYECGDLTLYLSKGKAVLDLGSGTGKSRYIIAQKVGKEGKVIVVNLN